MSELDVILENSEPEAQSRLIKQLMLELVGEDEPGKSPIDIGSEFSTPRDYKRYARNQLRAALRAKIESL